VTAFHRNPSSRAIAPALYAFTSGLGGSAQGFVAVTLGYVLAAHGISVAAIATLVGLRLLPETWRILFGPILDVSLNPRLWFLVSAVGAAICTLLFGLLPIAASNLWLFDLSALAQGAFANLCIVAQAASIAVTTAPEVRGRIAGWSQAGNLGGTGVGGGLGLWLATHMGVSAAAAVVALTMLACAWPMLLIRTPRPGAGLPLRVVGRGIVREVATLATTRPGLLVMLAVMLPMGLGAFLSLLPSVSSHWHASADLTALTTGALAGLASIPGCLIGGYLCDRWPPRLVLAGSGLVCALGEYAMVLAPKTPEAFVGLALLNNGLLGMAWAAVAAVIFVSLGSKGGGTIGALLGSLCNVPVVLVTFVLGVSEAHDGVEGMMMIEVCLGAISALTYGLIDRGWTAYRPAPLRVPSTPEP
jgi:MFS family permease